MRILRVFTCLQAGDNRIKLHTLYNGATIMQCNKYVVKYQKEYLDKTIGQKISAGQQKRIIEKCMNYTTY